VDIADDHHVVRHVPYQKLLKDEDGNVADSNGAAYGIFPQAFELREEDRNKLSVNWVEFFGKTTYPKNLDACIQDIRQNRGIKNGARCGFGIGLVSKIKSVCHSSGFTKVKIVHDPTRGNKSHTSIIRLPMNDSGLMQSLAYDAFTEIMLNS
jgi:hypothetical protein